MVSSFADHYGIDPAMFAETGALDPILAVDSLFFIDPSLLKGAVTPELAEGYERLQTYFETVLKVVSAVGNEGDRFWRQADQLLTFPEVRGLCIGYSKGGTSGSGMGPDLRKRLLESVHAIVKGGTKDPALFELVGAFEEDIGPDRISDMVAKVILPDLIAFTQRVCSDCGIEMTPLQASKGQPPEDLPLNPRTGGPVILVPREILVDLPVAESYADIGWIAQHNQAMRDKLNQMVGGAWGELTRGERKHILKRGFIEVPAMLAMVIDAYRQADRNPYNFDVDRAGEVIWYRTSKQVAHDFPLGLCLSEEPTQPEIEGVVVKICEHFRTLLEDNQLCKLLYDDKGKKKRESAAQLLFFGIASAYCEANDIDLTAESQSGRGPVDFKASRGFREKVLVEVKLTTNKNLIHGFEVQLPIYQKAENAPRGVYLVVDNGGSEVRLQKLLQVAAVAGNKAPRVIVADAKPRPSASKAEY